MTGSVHIRRRFTRVLVREHPLRQALADDDDFFGVAAVGVGEIAAGDDRHAERGEESRRDGAEPRARILFAVRLGVAFDRELRGEEALRRATARPCRPRPARRRAAPLMRRIASW